MLTASVLLLVAAGVHAQTASSLSEPIPIITNTGPALSSSIIASTTTVASSVITTLSASVATATPSLPVSASPSSPLPSQIVLPPRQAWCPSDIFCAGALLQTVNLAHLYPDDKTFIDKPTSKPPARVLVDFANLLSNGTGTNATYENAVQFVQGSFTGEGTELQPLPTTNNIQAPEDPEFLDGIEDPLVKAWSKTVNGYWTQLIRTTDESTLCDGVKCESSLIPLNHTFVVPGGRFREQYYWDSFWIVEGLIESGMFDIVNGTLQNFMDEIEQFGFIPNGGRIYYLNRSQPPLFIHMLANYVKASNDTAILKRGLRLAEAELEWWAKNRMVDVTSPFSNTTFTMARYAVTNSAPRPESYFTDYTTATASGTLNETQRSALYAELASGAESGWDYSSRWFTTVVPGSHDLTTLEVTKILPVCLNSILYSAYKIFAELSPDNSARSKSALARAASLRKGILELFWDADKLAFYDFNIRTNARNAMFTAAHFYPMWLGIVPDELKKNATSAFGAFSSLNLVLNRYNGTFPVTFYETGLQWDAPNTWPPHQYIALKALQALPSNVTRSVLPTPQNGQSTYTLIPANQLGLAESALPAQPISGEGTASQINSTIGDLNALNGTVVNGGQSVEGEGWGKALERMLANRYFTSAFCSWRATGGEIPGVLPRLGDAELNVTGGIGNTGNMFEKFSIVDIDSAGRGGEYTVQAGFGWTNGVVLWVASNYGDVLAAPQCPSLLVQNNGPVSASASSSGTTGPQATGSTGAATGSGNGAISVGGVHVGLTLLAGIVLAVVGYVV